MISKNNEIAWTNVHEFRKITNSNGNIKIDFFKITITKKKITYENYPTCFDILDFWWSQELMFLLASMTIERNDVKLTTDEVCANRWRTAEMCCRSGVATSVLYFIGWFLLVHIGMNRHKTNTYIHTNVLRWIAWW